ncbi:MAG: hypothetical protein DWG76_06790 [Chloroflexi bacterium]|nr:hypothetical protein [Chloroflexota bacterium]MQC27136.1 hypothetical protein [Chloroflexota bacterium]
MEKWRKNRLRGAWSLAWLFAMLFHQLAPSLLRGEAIDEILFVVVAVYFGVITFLFTWLFFLMPAWMAAIVLFVFGGFAEAALFGVLPNFWLGGLFYIAMFFVPRWISRRVWSESADSQEVVGA